MNKIFIGLAISVIGICAILGGIFGRTGLIQTDKGTTADIREDYREAVKIVAENYADTVKFENLTESSVQGMLWTLDPHSSFFTRDEFKKMMEDQSSSYYGIGVSIAGYRDGVYVQSLMANTPAAKAGLRYGDRIVAVNGEDAREWTSAGVSQKVRGAKGTPVKVKVERAGQKEAVEYEIVRGAVPYPSIRNYFMLRPNVGYIGLTGGFQETTSEELSEAIRNLKAQGMKQIVLDLRNNPGGLLPQAIEVSSRFIPRGQTVVSVRGRSKTARSEDYAATGNHIDDMPVVVLINSFSASASEIVAGAIQDYGRGLIVGEGSFGKGLVQRVFRLPGGTGLTLTTARYYTPFGRSLQRDYSQGSIYDYYTKPHDALPKESEQNETGEALPAPPPTGPAVETAGGRIFYGGKGIEPDIKVPPPAGSYTKNRIAEATFFFTRQLSSGQIAGLSEYRVEKTIFGHTLRPTDFPIGDNVFNAFQEFVAKEKSFGLTAEQIQKQADFVKLRLREEIVTAAFSNELGNQVLLEADPQVLKAVEVLPEAKKLAEATKASSNSKG